MPHRPKADEVRQKLNSRETSGRLHSSNLSRSIQYTFHEVVLPKSRPIPTPTKERYRKPNVRPPPNGNTYHGLYPKTHKAYFALMSHSLDYSKLGRQSSSTLQSRTDGLHCQSGAHSLTALAKQEYDKSQIKPNSIRSFSYGNSFFSQQFLHAHQSFYIIIIGIGERYIHLYVSLEMAGRVHQYEIAIFSLLRQINR